MAVLTIASQAVSSEIKYPVLNGNRVVEAKLGRPAQVGSDETGSPAVVLLHHGGGCSVSQTRAYADALNQAGFFTLEPCLFSTIAQRDRVAATYLPQVFGALRYLAQLPGVDKSRIAIAGGSYGGNLTLMSATRWANQVHGDSTIPGFAAHVPFYPTCFLIERFVRAGQSLPQIPADAYNQYTGAPIRIFAGTLDDYEDRDPQSCASMVSAIGEGIRPHVSIRLFPGATHGWDHGQTYSFYESVACKGKGCRNTNAYQPETTRQGIKELIEFLGDALKRR
jgi:dienelactone hydrolase